MECLFLVTKISVDLMVTVRPEGVKVDANTTKRYVRF
jgi:hypothetical protein